MNPGWAWQPFEPTDDRPWDLAAAAHLYRRAALGADRETLELAIRRPPGDVVDELISQSSEPGSFRQSADTLARTIVGGGDARRLAAAWVYRLSLTPNPMLEKATLFWHGHFATGGDKVTDPALLWQQNQLIRQHALGDFAALTHAIARDPAMLIYLDSAINRKSHPNENFARELMELFCLGEGNYTETDVRELARCFTGWEIKNNRFRKNRYQQDTDVKTVLGKTGALDGDEAIDVVLRQPSVERFLAQKWYRFFIADEPEPDAAILQPLADAFRAAGLNVAPVWRMMLGSNLFFSRSSVGAKIKSPVELILGMMRGLKVTTNADRVARGLQDIGQGLFFPPSVKGWDGGRSWINSSTLLGRSNLISQILSDPVTRFAGGSLTQWMHDHDVREIDDVIDWFETCFCAVGIDAATRQGLRDASNGHGGDVETALRSTLHAILSLPSSQIG